MFTLQYSNVFWRDADTYYGHGGTEERLREILDLLENGAPLPASLRDHQLQGKLRQWRELHVEGDWLLVYRKDGKKLIITCLWLVSHKKLRERGRL